MNSLIVKPVDPGMKEAIERFLANGGIVHKLPVAKADRK